MSAINQMLRELDARSATPEHASTALEAPPGIPRLRTPKRGWKPIGLGFSVLGMVIAAGYFAQRAEEGQPLTESAIPPATPIVARSVVLPPPSLAAGPSPVMLHDPAERPAIVVQTPPTLSATAPMVSENPVAVLRKPGPGAALLTHTPALRAFAPAAAANAPETPAPKVSEVIKRPVELSPAAATFQLLDEANALRREGKADAAQRKYREVLERNPGLVSARVQLAESMNEQGEAEAAMALLKTAYTQQPEAALAVALGRMLANRGQRAEALTWLGRGSSALRPGDHALTAALLAQEQRYPEAIRAYLIALSVEPHQGGWQLGLGLAYEATGQRENAQVAYKQALAWGEFKPEVIKFLSERSGIAP